MSDKYILPDYDVYEIDYYEYKEYKRKKQIKRNEFENLNLIDDTEEDYEKEDDMFGYEDMESLGYDDDYDIYD